MYLLIRLYPLVEWYIYRLPTKLRENKVFIGAYLFTKWGGGLHQATTHDALDLTHTRYGHQTWDLPLLISGGQHLRPVQTYSLEDPLSLSDIWWWHWGTYALQAGGTHPTGMLSCRHRTLTWPTSPSSIGSLSTSVAILWNTKRTLGGNF